MRAILLLLVMLTSAAAAPLLPGFRHSPWFGEQVREEWHDGGVRIMMNAAGDFDAKKPTHLVIYATPNGNTIEQTLGCAKAEGIDWHFDIQHVAAQVRRWREVTPAENTVLAVVEAGGLSWPNYRAKFKDNPERIKALVAGIVKQIPGECRITLTGHSGGGSFITGFINGHDAIPKQVTRIAHLDSNYSYSDDEKHGDKLLAWLKASDDNRLVVIAYDDREIMLNGKKVVGPTGGTWRATDRMLARFRAEGGLEIKTASFREFETHMALDGRLELVRHRNPENKILHTALVGEMNGFLAALEHGREFPWGTFAEKRSYTRWIQPAPVMPKRKPDALAASGLIPVLKSLSKADREGRIAAELLAGNMPLFEHKFTAVKWTANDAAGKPHTIEMKVLPDYLSLGTDADWLRMPMTPQTATRVAEAFGCVLPTKLLADRIHAAAAVKLEPIPLGEPREALEQFVNHQQMIEAKRTGRLGELVSGVKKDIVLSNRIFEKPRRLALYGWHQADGKPIQPLTIVHHDGYVDYSHGVRLIQRVFIVDGKPKDFRDLVRDANLAPLVSDEGVFTRPGYE